MFTYLLILLYVHVTLELNFQPTPQHEQDKIEGVCNQLLAEDAGKPVLEKSLTSLMKTQLPCDWSKNKHWCNFHHFMTCLRPEEITNDTTSITFHQLGKLLCELRAIIIRLSAPWI